MIQANYFSTDPLIGNHLNHYHHLLDAGNDVALSELVDTYLQMGSLLHQEASASSFDLAALNYAATRLPEKAYLLKKIVLSQSLSELAEAGFSQTNDIPVYTPNRRRLWYLNPDTQTLYCYLNSASDIDDIVNILLIYYVEFQKIKSVPQNAALPVAFTEARGLEFNPSLRLFPTTENAYQQNCHQWWTDTAAKTLYLNLDSSPVYFVSSNAHSLTNLIGGFINLRQNYIFDFLAHDRPEIYNSWFKSKVEHNLVQTNDFLYYFAGEYLKSNPDFIQEKETYEKNLGVIKIKSNTFPANIQIIPLSSLTKSTNLDPNLKIADPQKLARSNALIVNIQYPLGIAAKYLLTEIQNYFTQLRGIYIMGKAAILNGQVGDIQIPEIVLDETNNNIYRFNNVFNSAFNFSALQSNILNHQKAACVYGTILENRSQIENYLKTGFNIIEMESSHYLSAIAQKYLSANSENNANNIFHLDNLPIDLGIINYASDNPISQNLGHETLALNSVETTYLSSLAVLQRILDLESLRS